MYRSGVPVSTKVSIISSFGDRPRLSTMKDEKCDAVITGFMSDSKSILEAREYICDIKLDNPNTFVLVDPVFAKDGTMYEGITKEHVTNYKKLMEIADLVTPNITEACVLTDSSYDEYRDKYITIKYENDNKEKIDALSKKIIESIFTLFDKLRVKKNQATIVTGIEMYNAILTVLDVYDGDHAKRQTTCNYAEKIDKLDGAGDIFNSMYLETCMNGFNMIDALSVTTSFINNALRFTRDQKFSKGEGIVYEPILFDNIVVIKNKLKEMNNQKNSSK